MEAALTPADLIRTPVVTDSAYKPGLRATPKIVAVTLPVEATETPAVTP